MEDFANGCKFVILNKHIKEEVYLEQPMGYMAKGHENKILKLKSALYGLKQTREHIIIELINIFKIIILLNALMKMLST